MAKRTPQRSSLDGTAVGDGSDEWDESWDDGWDDGWEDVPVDDEDFVYVPEDRGIVRKLVAIGVCLAVFVFLVLGFGGYWLYQEVNPGGGGEEVLLVIPNDAGLATISRLLEEKEVISNATIFRYYAKWKNIPTIKAGSYDKLVKHDSMDHVIERLKQGPMPPKFTTVNIPEGLWVSDAFAKIKQAYPEMTDLDLATAAQAIKSKFQPADKPIDGFLFPATYRVEDDDKDDEAKLIDQMVKKFDQVGDEAGLGDPMKNLGPIMGKTQVSPYEVLIVASLIEGEAKVSEDRGKIARVIYNRLKVGEPLGIDAALFVALGEHKTEITKADLELDSPYNLRKRPGLPPTPINSPGKDSITAAMNPATEPGAESWKYYVLIDKEGHHFFTGNYNEFLKAQQKAREQGLL